MEQNLRIDIARLSELVAQERDSSRLRSLRRQLANQRSKLLGEIGKRMSD